MAVEMKLNYNSVSAEYGQYLHTTNDTTFNIQCSMYNGFYVIYGVATNPQQFASYQ